MSLGEFLPSSSTKLLLHLNGNSTDSSGNGNNGTDTAITYSQANGKFGQGAKFNGSTSKIEVGSTTTFDFGTNPYTISLWFNLSSTFSNGQGPILLSSNLSYGHLVTYNNLVSGGISYEFGYTGSGWAGVIETDVNAISINNWYNLVIVREGTGANQVKMYINGSQKGSTGTYGNNSADARTDKLILGQAGWFTGTYTGAEDEVIIENRAWSASEVKKYYTYSRGFYSTI